MVKKDALLTRLSQRVNIVYIVKVINQIPSIMRENANIIFATFTLMFKTY